MRPIPNKLAQGIINDVLSWFYSFVESGGRMYVKFDQGGVPDSVFDLFLIKNNLWKIPVLDNKKNPFFAQDSFALFSNNNPLKRLNLYN
jgi:hypothetical protein